MNLKKVDDLVKFLNDNSYGPCWLITASNSERFVLANFEPSEEFSNMINKEVRGPYKG